MLLSDTHCHLELEQFEADLQQVLQRACQAGIARILIPGIDCASSQRAVRLAEGHPPLFAAVGVHPTEAAGFKAKDLEALRSLAGHPKVKAIGEIGLDDYWASDAREIQKQVFKEQLTLAAECNLPVVVHFREKRNNPQGECAAELMSILEDWLQTLVNIHSPLAEKPGVLHSFSGSLEMARKATQLGFFIGVTGHLTYPQSQRTREWIASLPLETMLLETDAPFQTPFPHQEKRNEPAYIRLIADKIALLKNCTVDKVATLTSGGASFLFGWN